MHIYNRTSFCATAILLLSTTFTIYEAKATAHETTEEHTTTGTTEEHTTTGTTEEHTTPEHPSTTEEHATTEPEASATEEKVVTVIQQSYFPPATKCPVLKDLLTDAATSVATGGGYKVMFDQRNTMKVAGKIDATDAHVFESNGKKYALILEVGTAIDALISMKDTGTFTPKAISNGCSYTDSKGKTLAYIAAVK